MPPLKLLPRDELARRLRAARELRGIEQDALGDLFGKDGLGKTDPGRLEREDPKVTLTRARLDALVRHLRVPERWFTSDDVDEVVGYIDTEQSLRWALDELRQRMPPGVRDTKPEAGSVEELLDELRLATRHAEQLLGRLGRDVGRRDLQSRRAKGPTLESASNVA